MAENKLKVVAFNGSPRKKANTGVLLEFALQGAADCGAETKLVHLYDLNYKGCRSCFACKIIDGPSYGHCVIKDDLAEVIEDMEKADVIVFGSPIYLYDITGELRSFLERVFFSHGVYDPQAPTLWPKKVRSGIIYTMNVKDEKVFSDNLYMNFEEFVNRILGHPPEILYATDTRQFDDYTKYYAPKFDGAEKQKNYETVFPEQCKQAYALGRRLVEQTINTERSEYHESN